MSFCKPLTKTPRLRSLAVVAVVPLALAVSTAPGQIAPDTSPDGVWRGSAASKLDTAATIPIAVRRFRLFQVDGDRLTDALGAGDSKAAASSSNGAPTVLALPMPDGSFTRITAWEDPLLSPDLQVDYPDIKTYSGQGLDDPTMTVVLDQTELGFHAQIIGERGTVLVDPVDRDAGLYMSYWKHDAVRGPFQCLLEGKEEADPLHAVRSAVREGAVTFTNPSGTTRRTYNLRMTTTDEYTNFFGSRTAAASQVTTTVNRVRGIYEREVSVSFTLISIDTLLQTDAGYPFAVPAVVNGAFLNANNNYLDSTYGSSSYDIGHVVGRGGGGGLAGVGVVCGGSKGQGGTQLNNPVGDAFDVDYVAHEMGHQMGGTHTFNGVTSNCSGSNRDATSSYEPGSGTTIMAYAGICGVDDVQPHSDDYFHTRSFDQITGVRDSAGCGALTNPTGNNPPSVSAGADYTIPQNTPFTLTATGSDPDGDAITFNWEEFDLGPASSTPVSSDTQAPLFRSRPATSSASRTLPRLADILSGAMTPFEVLPTVNRTMNFRVTARDNIGGVRWDDMAVTVSGGPFRLTAPAGGSGVECGLPNTITWDVGGGSVAPDVRVDFSTDNGATFSTVVPSTPNDGSEPVALPKSPGVNRRVLLAGLGNIFFSVSGPFSIVDTLNPTVTSPADLSVECTQKSPQGATPNIGAATATDVCDPSVPVTNNAPAVFPLGTTVVTWSGQDDSGNTGSATQRVTVKDTLPPVIPPDIPAAECTSPDGTPVDIGTPSDVCDPNPTFSNNAPALFPFGSTSVLWTATDQSGNTATGTQVVTVVDTTPPTLTVSLSPTILWPPNHRLVNIQASITVSDACDAAPTVRLVSITSSEPDKGTGPHDRPHDIQGAAFGTDDRRFRLRAEHSPGGVRTYTVTYTAEDKHGNTTTVQTTVRVPKSGATLISRNSVPADDSSTAVAINADGSLVAFSSDATNLVAHDSNQVRDVFVRDRAAGTTERVSVSSAEEQANGASSAPAISGTGQFVAFSSSATNLVPGDGNRRLDVFVHDRVGGTTERVSVAGVSTEANGASGAPSISADGRFVAFQSLATNLVSGDSNGASDIFVRNRLTQSTERICGMVQGNSFSIAPAISADGAVVAFASAATNLVPGDTNGRIDIFTCDRTSGALERISVSGGGEQADGNSFLPAISRDGRYVAFKSLADNLVPGDYNGLVDVFVRDRVAGTTERVSVNRYGGDADGISFPPSISYEGRFVAFGSLATNLVGGDVNDVADVFVRDRQTGVTYLVDVNDEGQEANRGTADIAPALTGDGLQVGFVSLASNLAGPDNGARDVFVVCNPAAP